MATRSDNFDMRPGGELMRPGGELGGRVPQGGAKTELNPEPLFTPSALQARSTEDETPPGHAHGLRAGVVSQGRTASEQEKQPRGVCHVFCPAVAGRAAGYRVCVERVTDKVV